MKKFVILAWDTYYPGGGLSNVVGSEDSLDDAKRICVENQFRQKFASCEYTMEYDHAEVADRDTWEIVWTRPNK